VIGEIIGNIIVGAAAVYVAGNVFYWIGRLTMGLSIGEWKLKENDAEEWSAMMTVGFFIACIGLLLGVIAAGLGHAILRTVGA